MSLTQFTTDISYISALPDSPTPNGGYTKAQLKAEFDKAGNALKTFINETMIAEIETLLSANVSYSDTIINIKNFGAKGDGVTDDTEAIQNALNYVESLGGGIVLVPKSSGDFMLSDTVSIGSNTTIEFKGGSYFKLSTYTSIGTVIINKSGAKNITLLNPLIDGGGSAIIVGSSGQNGISCITGGMLIIGGHVRNCSRGLSNGDGGKGIQCENHNIDFVCYGTLIENCGFSISAHKDGAAGNEGNVKAVFDKIRGKNCEQFATFELTNTTDGLGQGLLVSVTEFIAENCGSLDGAIILSRAKNVYMKGRIVNSSTYNSGSITSVIRGRHERCSFDLEVIANVDSVIFLNPSTYAASQDLAQHNTYNFRIISTYNYLLKSDTTGSTYTNRALLNSVINAVVNSDAATGIIENNSKDLSTLLNIVLGAVKLEGNASDIFLNRTNLISTSNNAIEATLQNSWTNYDAVDKETAGYYKEGNRVFLKGIVVGANASAIFTLPILFRPSKILYRTMTYFNGTAYVVTHLMINPTGVVQLIGAPTGMVFMSIGGLSFKAEQ